MFLGYSALRSHCAVRIRCTCTPKNAIVKTRYLGGACRHPRTFRTRSSPDTALPRPPVSRMTSDRCKSPRTVLLQVRDHIFSKSDFHNSSKFLGKGESESQMRISDLWGHLRTPGRPHRGPGSVLIRSAIEFSTISCVRWSRDLSSKTNNSKNSKNLFGQVSYKTCST